MRKNNGHPDRAPARGDGKNPTPEQAAENLVNALASSDQHAWMKAIQEAMAAAENPQGDGVPELSVADLDAMMEGLEDQSKRIVDKAIKEQTNLCGNVPQHMQKHLEREAVTVKVPWNVLLRGMLAASIRTRRVAVPSRPHRRRYMIQGEDDEGNPIIYESPVPVFPGYREDPTFTLIYAIDVSGSMSDQEVLVGLRELVSLKKQKPDVAVLVMQVDTHISSMHLLDVDDDPEEFVAGLERTAAGGTHFYAPFQAANHIMYGTPPPVMGSYVDSDLLNELGEPGLIVYHTDGGGTAPPYGYCKVPTIWTLSRGNKPHFTDDAPFGAFIDVSA